MESGADSGRYLEISGGTLVINAEGDGLDSNGSLIMTGGTVVVEGPLPTVRHHPVELRRLRQITGHTVECRYLPQRHQTARQLPAGLAGRAGEQHLHSNTSASASSTPALSLAESSGAPSSGQSMPIAGSFHITLRSCSGA